MTTLSTLTSNDFSKWFQPVPALQGKSLMNHLYNRLDGAYPHKWRSNFPTPEAIENWSVSWAEAFEDERITPAMVKDGLKACRNKYEWPPSCAEFIKACKPSLDPLVSYYEAVAGVQARSKGEMGTWSSPAVYWAAMPLSFDLGSQSYSQIKMRWEQALNEQLDRGEWPEIPNPFIALAAPDVKITREAAAKSLSDIGAGSVMNSKSDHKLWAKKILKQAEKKNHGLSMIQIKFAKEALSVV